MVDFSTTIAFLGSLGAPNHPLVVGSTKDTLLAVGMATFGPDSPETLFFVDGEPTDRAGYFLAFSDFLTNTPPHQQYQFVVRPAIGEVSQPDWLLHCRVE
jgi:hypothetical protein